MNEGAIAEKYMSSILGQQNPLDLSKVSSGSSSGSDDSIFMQLLQVDSLQNLGHVDKAKKALAKLIPQDPCRLFFRDGLTHLLDGDLSDAYESFVQASIKASGLEAVFYGERAVNIAFWIACSGKMLKAAKDLDIQKQPYAGGVLSFAKYMNGSVKEAEDIARQAMADGFCDPWTLHSIAHCLYSQGKSKECIEFLDQHRSAIHASNPSAFMKGHMEFHQALCFIDLEDVPSLHNLIDGPLWKDLAKAEREDYWNATGLLNVQWKAELRGLRDCVHLDSIREAMKILMPTASASKSPVFSLSILRWTTGDFRKQWREELLKSDNEVLRDLTKAVDTVYPSSKDDHSSLSADACQEAVEKYLAKNVDSLDKLGASPEQREVIEEFVVVAVKAAGKGETPIRTVDLAGWTARNYRPNTVFYESSLGLKSP